MYQNRSTILLLALMLTLFTSCKKDDDSDPNTPSEIFNTVWNDFDITYPYFAHKKIDWDSIYSVYNTQIDNNTSSTELFEILGEMTLALKDIHVVFYSNEGLYHYSKKENYPENPPDNAVNYLEEIILDNPKCTYASISNSNYSYLRIKTFTGSSSEFQDAVSTLDSLNKKEGLVIDIRHNGGGNEINGRAFAGKFVQSTTLYKYVRLRNGTGWSDFTGWSPSYFEPNNPLQYDKNIILLTNRRVYSSAELFTLMMKTLPNLIIVGDTTGGASANPKLQRLPNGWEYRVSTWQSATLDHTLIEDNGIAPDHNVLMTENSIITGKDFILEKAINLLDEQKVHNIKN